jgi:ABC-type transporter Mla subunit MlaD
MPAQDLTPQLRTRLSRLEKVVGWFVTFAALLLLGGLAFYIYNLAERKGWLLTKAPYFIYLESGAGIKPGDPVRLMGFDAGKITKVVPEAPESGENVYVEFEMFSPNIGYVWDDSMVRVRSANFLGARYLEVTKGGTRVTNDVHATYKEAGGNIVAAWSRTEEIFTNWTKRTGGPYWLPSDEPPELSSQLDQTVQMLKISLTNILQLTNALTRTLTNAAEATANLNELLTEARPLVRNVTVITANLREPRGSLGEWVFPTNMNYQLTALLTNANATVGNVNTTVTNANTNLVTVFSNVNETLENLAGITSNLNAQVQRNGNIVSSVSKLIVDSDEMIQGLKRHWLLRSAFKNKGKEKEDSSRPDAQDSRPSSTSLRPTNPKGAGRE